MPNTAPEPEGGGFLQVAAAAILNDRAEVLLALRPAHVHQGGLWEFPGGKVEPGESVQEALQREIREELGIEIRHARPLIRIPFRYPDRRVLLDVWRVDSFDGIPRGAEGQTIEWVAVEALRERAFPEANRPIVHALQLPTEYLITPEPAQDEAGFLKGLQRCLDSGVRLVQLRAKSLAPAAYAGLAEKVLACCRERGARLLLNAAPDLVLELGADGIHLTAEGVRGLVARPLPADRLVAASCHDPGELRAAQRIGADFVVLSPVAATASHPGRGALGWARFSEWVDPCPMPVFALGGLGRKDLGQAIQCGAQGIAAIRGLWGTC
ncbi:MAG TPA: Nudix family hydrolase [Gammaproteobacteria bacterium]|nr:Nudix family hydrolase [Gammaproteobacteria bacterium]